MSRAGFNFVSSIRLISKPKIRRHVQYPAEMLSQEAVGLPGFTNFYLPASI